MNHSTPLHPRLQKIQVPALVIGVVALAIWMISLFVMDDRQPAFVSYLLAYMFWIGIPLGCFSILMLQHLTGGRWGLAIRRPLESATRLLPLMALFFIPLLFGMDELYGWTHDHELKGFRAAWLSTDRFIFRAILYFAIWILIAFVLNKWSRDQDRGDRPQITRRMQLLSGPGLLLYGLTISGAAVDWVMSLEHHWYSTMFGMIFMVGQALGALALMIALVALLSRTRPLSEIVTTDHFNDLGNLLLAFVMLWAYVSFAQYLIIYSGNLAEEAPYYVKRTETSWKYVALALIILHFFVPFVLLLSRRTKRSLAILTGIALTIVVMRFVDLYWLIVPAAASSHEGGHVGHATEFAGFHVHPLDFLTPIGIGGIWIAVYIWQLKRRPLVPLHDPRLEEVDHHHG